VKKNNHPASKTNKKIWDEFINNPTGIFDKDQQSDIQQSNQTRFRFDLHGYSLNEANQKIEELLSFCIEKKYSELLLITGKGLHSNSDNDVFSSKDLSKLKYSVPEYIKSLPELYKLIKSIEPAPKDLGGEGALIIKIKKL
tara:strand:- start:7 stop:429 length:423 start_codon:yes stop_codon:yes gene_type:complete